MNDSAATNAARAFLIAIRTIAQVARFNEPVRQATLAVEGSDTKATKIETGPMSPWVAAIDALVNAPKPLACAATLDNGFLAIECRQMADSERVNWQRRAETVLSLHVANLRRMLHVRDADPAILFQVENESVSLTLPEYQLWKREYEITLDHSLRLTPAVSPSTRPNVMLRAEFGRWSIHVIKRAM